MIPVSHSADCFDFEVAAPMCHITDCFEVGAWKLNFYSGPLPKREDGANTITVTYCDKHFQVKDVNSANRMSNIQDLRKPYSTYLAEFEKELWS